MKNFTHIAFIITLIFTNTLASTADWWEDASFYQIYPRSWKDSDGNGVGDLNGITENLEYLKEVGITATWLSPIFKSPMSDFGYDISNFYEIDPIFGTMEDFDALIKKAKKIGIKIILDFVPNHSSEECEWFQKSVDRVEGYEDFYIWENGFNDPQNPGQKLPPNNWISVFGGKAWTWNEKRQQFYFHQFQKQQPDFNFRNPKVHEAMLEVMKFWLDRGIDGFRIDAVPHIYEKMTDDGNYPNEPLTGWTSDPDSYSYLRHIYTTDQPETAELMYEWRHFLDTYKKLNGGDTRILLAEAYSPIEITDRYYSNGTSYGAHLPFNFKLLDSFNKTSDAFEIENSIKLWMDVMWSKHQVANWVMGNHDKQRIASRVGKEKIDLINILLASLPGASVTYYGEEIGMSDVSNACTGSPCEDRIFQRSPFQWNDKISAGFSTSEKPWIPVSNDFKKVNVKIQRGVTRSVLNVFKDIHKLRRSPAFKAFKDPNGFSYGAVNHKVFQIIRSNNIEEYRILLNMGNQMEIVGPLSNSVHSGDYIMEYVIVTRNSAHSVGDKVNLNKIYLMPNEAIVLKRVVNKYTQ